MASTKVSRKKKMPPKKRDKRVPQSASESYDTNSKRCRRFQKSGRLHSKKIIYSSNKNDVATDKRNVQNLLRQCAEKIIDAYFQDDTKAPMNNGVKPALFAKPSFNIYFGDNVGNGDGVTTLDRAAYATGTGASSIGLNPETMKIYPVFPELRKLMRLASKIVKRESKVWKKEMNKNGGEFHACGIKLYYSFMENGVLVTKTTNWHMDVTLDENGIPTDNNSQIPGSPVVIFTFGDKKDLYLRQYYWKTGQEVVGSQCVFPQENGSMTVIDGIDETVDKHGRTWYHMSELPQKDGLTFSFMCRQVQKSVEVNRNNNTIANPTLTPIKTILHRRGQKIFQTKKYKFQRRQMDEKFKTFFARFPKKKMPTKN